jgi:Alpha galactosidase A/Alpha galactosidase C-terminal beta sandwich domain
MTTRPGSRRAVALMVAARSGSEPESGFLGPRLSTPLAILTLACAALGITPTAVAAADSSRAAEHFPLVVASAQVRVQGGRVVGRVRIANRGLGPVRPTVAWVSLRRVSRGELTGVAEIAVDGLARSRSRTVQFRAAMKAGSIVPPGTYVAVVCLDVDSQIETFGAARNCAAAGRVTVARGRKSASGSARPEAMIERGPLGTLASSSAAFAFVSTAKRTTFECRLDAGPWIPCRSPQRYAALVEGRHTFDVRASNRSGVATRRPAHASWIVNTQRSAMTTELATTPYMGWNTYYGVGGVFEEQTIISVADALINRGLAQAGYQIVWLDFGWASGERDGAGQLIVNRQQWPHGLAWLTAWLHEHGLLAGIYTDAAASGCDGRGVGSLGHYQQDANAFAAWGFDAVKLDFCGAGQQGLAPRSLDAQFAAALRNNSSGRRMLLNVCNFWAPGQIDGHSPSLADSAYANYQWAPAIAESWRTDTDIGFAGTIRFEDVLRNLDADAGHPEAAGRGHWNDPDYLGPELGMTYTEAQTQLSLWAIVAAPLILGSDPRALSQQTITMLENRQVIEIDQDPLGAQGSAIQRQGDGQVWVKPLAGGERAVALLNRGTSDLRITTNAAAVGLSRGAHYRLEDLWAHTTMTTSGIISAHVPAHGVVLYRVARA